MTITATRTAAVSRPMTITTSFWLFLLSFIITVVSTATSVAEIRSPEATARLADAITSTPQATEGELDTDTLVAIAQATTIGLQIAGAIIAAVVVLWVAFALRAGLGFIRIVATVLLAAQLIALVAAPTLLSALSAVVVTAAVALTWFPASGHFFAESRQRRLDAPAAR